MFKKPAPPKRNPPGLYKRHYGGIALPEPAESFESYEPPAIPNEGVPDNTQETPNG